VAAAFSGAALKRRRAGTGVRLCISLFCGIAFVVLAWSLMASVSGGHTGDTFTETADTYTITWQKYDSIEMGMSYAQVGQTLGMPGTLQSPHPSDPRVGTATFEWGSMVAGSDWVTVTVVFENDAVTRKSQHGLF
jgi:hypothetical protein